MFFLDLMIKYVFFYSGSDFLKEFVKRIWNKNMLFVKFYVLFFILGWFFYYILIYIWIFLFCCLVIVDVKNVS